MADFEHDLEKMLAAVCLGESSEIDLPEIAARYAATCQQVNERLRRCVELLKKGLRDEALQHAKTPPPVLDQFAAADFPEREAWVQFTRSRGLTMPPPLQTPLAIELNTAFAEAETLKDSAKRHRLLALARAPLERRLVVLWRLAQLDPLNPIWTKDLQVFETARHRQIEQELAQAHQAGQLPRLQELVKEVTTTSWTTPPPPALAQRARSLRDQHLARAAQERIVPIEQQLTAATTAGNRAAALALFDEARTLRAACGLAGTHPVIQRLDLALAWVDKQNQRDARQREWLTECAKLRQLAENPPSAEALERQEQKVLGLGMGMPADLEQYLRDVIAELDRRRRKVQMAWLAAAFLVVIVFVVAMIAWIRLRGGRGETSARPSTCPPSLPARISSAIRHVPSWGVVFESTERKQADA